MQNKIKISGDVVERVARAIEEADKKPFIQLNSIKADKNRKYELFAKAALASLPDHSELCKEIDESIDLLNCGFLSDMDIEPLSATLSKCKAALSIKN